MNNINILIHLLNNKEKKFTINQISKDLKINYRIAHTQVKELEKEGIIKTEEAGKALLCSLINKFNEKIFISEYIRKKKLLQNKDFQAIVERFEEAKQNYILLLFGSYAKNKQTKHSDIDLFAITENEKEIKLISELIPKKIHLTIASYDEFTKMILTKELNVGLEVLKNNIILIGIEEFYRLIQNAQ